MRKNHHGSALIPTLLLFSITTTAAEPPVGFEAPLEQALSSIKAEGLLADIKTLASDEFEGRGPGTPGEEKSVAFLIDRFKSMGLAPGHPNGGYVQEVPLVGFRATSMSGAVEVRGQAIDLKFPKDWVAVSRRQADEVSVENSDVVFVGYGVVAPEYGWDDYKGVDVAGKTLIMLVNDPAIPDPTDSTKLDPKMFKGSAMTYYGRWTYKYEIGTAKGAAAVLLIHETEAAGYPYEVVIGSWGRENFDIATPGREVPRLAVEAWISLEKAKELFSASGKEFLALKAAARLPDFQPVALNAKASLQVKSTRREVLSKNVVAKREGSDPALKGQSIIYTAHWDHLGRDSSLPGDQIFNGAADNASGTAGLLALAGAFQAVDPPPRRTIVFLAVTAEEKGLLGAKYYAENPLYPLESTLANINMDVLNLWGPTRDIVSIGLGQCSLDETLAVVARARGKRVAPDAEPEKGLFYRSDHFEFAKKGIPALDTKAGIDYVGKPEGYGKKTRQAYVANDYHKVSDEVKPDWELSGAVEDLRLLGAVGYRIAQGDTFPEWKPGSEFLEIRRASLSAAKPKPRAGQP